MNPVWINVLLALTNLTAVLPLSTVYYAGDRLTLFFLGFVSFFSFFSHLVQNHKHGQVGFWLPKCLFPTPNDLLRFSINLNRCDLLGCYLMAGRFLEMAVLRDLWIPSAATDFVFEHLGLFILTCCAFVLLRISEMNPQQMISTRRIKQHTWRYLILHGIWHLSIYYLIDSCSMIPTQFVIISDSFESKSILISVENNRVKFIC